MSDGGLHYRGDSVSLMATGFGCGNQRHQRCNVITRVIVFGCLGMALFGYDTGVVSGAMVLLTEDIELNTVEKELFVSSTIAWAAAGTIIGIPLNSRLGRKPVIMVSAILYITGSVLITGATGIVLLVIGQSFLGAAIGFASGTVPMYAAEIAPASMRGMIVTLMDFNIVFGQLFASIVNGVIKDLAGGWRISMGLAAVPAVFLFVGFCFLPESPRWLVMNGQVADAEAVLRLCHHDEIEVQKGLEDIKNEVRLGGDGPCKRSVIQRCGDRLSTIWGTSSTRRAAILGISLMALNQLSGINTIMYYSSTILLEAGFEKDMAIWLAAACCAAQLIGVIISVCSMDTAGRRKTALRSCVGVVITLLILATSFFENPTNAAEDEATLVKKAMQSVDSHFWRYFTVAGFMLYLIAFGSGLSGVPWVVNSEIYPLRVRTAAVAQAIFLNWVFNYSVGATFLTLCERLTISGLFLLFAGFSVLGAVTVYFFLPETMGLELEDIEVLFQDPYPKNLRTHVLDSDPDNEDEADESPEIIDKESSAVE